MSHDLPLRALVRDGQKQCKRCLSWKDPEREFERHNGKCKECRKAMRKGLSLEDQIRTLRLNPTRVVGQSRVVVPVINVSGNRGSGDVIAGGIGGATGSTSEVEMLRAALQAERARVAELTRERDLGRLELENVVRILDDMRIDSTWEKDADTADESLARCLKLGEEYLTKHPEKRSAHLGILDTLDGQQKSICAYRTYVELYENMNRQEEALHKLGMQAIWWYFGPHD